MGDDDDEVRDWATMGLGSILTTDSEAIQDALNEALKDPLDGELGMLVETIDPGRGPFEPRGFSAPTARAVSAARGAPRRSVTDAPTLEPAPLPKAP